MECPRCGLNNMPGSAICFQCGADLAEKKEKAVYYPPRAKKRGMRHGVTRKASRRPIIDSEIAIAIKERFGIIDLLPYIGRGLLSLLPGLGQVINGQYYKGLIFFTAALCLGFLSIVWFWHLFWGFIVVLFFLNWFAAVVDAAIFSIVPEKRQNLNISHYAGISSIMVSVFFLIALIANGIVSNYFLFQRINFKLINPVIQRGELIFCWRVPYGMDDLKRNDIVTIATVYVGQIIGLPEETIRIEESEIFAGNESLGKLPGLKLKNTRFELNAGEYLVFYPQNTRIAMDKFRKSKFTSKVIGVWHPFIKHRRLNMFD